MRAKRFHQQVPAVRSGGIDALVREPCRCVTLNPDYSRGDDVKRHTSITQRLPREDENGEVMVAGGLDVPGHLESPIAGELRLSQERQDSRLLEDGTKRECRHGSDFPVPILPPILTGHSASGSETAVTPQNGRSPASPRPPASRRRPGGF